MCKLFSDGRRQIVAFHVVDEIFGFERSDERGMFAEAVSEVSVVVLPRCGVDALAHSDRQLARDIVTSTLVNLERAQRHAVVLGRMLAPERIATFLLDMAERLHSDAFVLPMSRTDIADYLGLTIETVSRTLMQFRRQAIIHLSAARRDVVLRDKATLRRLGQAGLRSPYPNWTLVRRMESRGEEVWRQTSDTHRSNAQAC
jgi:CRP/FNR family nitrogen fixation transcriptional regulator